MFRKATTIIANHPNEYSELCQISRWSFFCKNIGFKPLTIFTKSSILDAWQGSEYASDINTSIKMQYKTFKGRIRTLLKKTVIKWLGWKKYQNRGKSFIFYIFLRRNRSNSPQQYNEWDSTICVFQWICEIFKNTIFIEHQWATVFKKM